MDMIIEIDKRCKNKSYYRIQCNNIQLVEKYADYIYNLPENKIIKDTLDKKKKLSEKDKMLKFYSTRYRFNNWIFDGDDNYYKKLVACTMHPEHPVSERGLQYIAKINKKQTMLYTNLSVKEVFDLIDLGYTEFPKIIYKLRKILRGNENENDKDENDKDENDKDENDKDEEI